MFVMAGQLLAEYIMFAGDSSSPPNVTFRHLILRDCIYLIILPVRASCANHEFVVTGYEFIPSDPKFRPNGSEFGVTGILKYHIFQFS